MIYVCYKSAMYVIHVFYMCDVYNIMYVICVDLAYLQYLTPVAQHNVVINISWSEIDSSWHRTI